MLGKISHRCEGQVRRSLCHITFKSVGRNGRFLFELDGLPGSNLLSDDLVLVRRSSFKSIGRKGRFLFELSGKHLLLRSTLLFCNLSFQRIRLRQIDKRSGLPTFVINVFGLEQGENFTVDEEQFNPRLLLKIKSYFLDYFKLSECVGPLPF